MWQKLPVLCGYSLYNVNHQMPGIRYERRLFVLAGKGAMFWRNLSGYSPCIVLTNVLYYSTVAVVVIREQ